MSVKSQQNKELLSQLLETHPLNQSNPSEFETFLNTQLNIMHNTRFRYNNNLVDMNKEILRIFQDIKYTVPQRNPFVSKNGQEEELVDEVPKIKIFETRLKEQQDHFNSLIKAEIPKEIDFTDKTTAEETINDNTIDGTMHQREKELQKIMESYKKDKKAEAWLKGDNIKPDNSPTTATNSIIKRNPTIGENKKVSFQEIESHLKPENNTNSLFNKLKIKNTEVKTKYPNTQKEKTIDYSDYLLEIIENQKKIIEHFTKVERSRKADTF